MQMSLVLIVIGNDRPGIVESLAGPIAAVGANWEESRMARLAGKFAGLLRVSVDDAKAADLEARLSSLAATGLKVVVERSDEAPSLGRQVLRLELVGNDRPGIVRDVPPAVMLDVLRRQLEALAGELMVDLEIDRPDET